MGQIVQAIKSCYNPWTGNVHFFTIWEITFLVGAWSLKSPYKNGWKFLYEPRKRPEFDPYLLVGEGLPPDLLRGWGPLSNSLEGIIMDVHLHCSGSNSFWSYLLTYCLLLHSYQQVAALKKGGSTVELKVIHSSAGSLGTEALRSWKPRVARDAGFCMKLAVRGPNCALYW